MNQRISGLSRPVQFLLAILLLMLCVLADYFSGAEISFSITCLAPTAFAVWYAGALPGVVTAITAALLWYGVDYISGPAYSHPMVPVWNSLVRLGFFFIVTVLLLQIRNLLRQLQSLAETDSLTDLANSRKFYARLEQERERALRYPGFFTVAYLDLDNFKQINDSWGHDTGDLVLQAFARCLTENLRKTDVVARLGGDEFALLLAETDEEKARDTLQKLHLKILETMAAQEWPVGCSVGAISCANASQFSSSELIHRADELMYEVKRAGKNGVAVITIPCRSSLA
ncbi:GGDEF domain-containing protein [Geopsychrobacter electrodiphilus]|uniref:GGDEF domain-containing protein n=1 Tax=Geopsychrobacter electrodiphilus TaxID=225196 RepID=UPI00036AA02C|nr:GGDEF domain-containing protein [Geopsychrobacter electrodiphilus]